MCSVVTYSVFLCALIHLVLTETLQGMCLYGVHLTDEEDRPTGTQQNTHGPCAHPTVYILSLRHKWALCNFY